MAIAEIILEQIWIPWTQRCLNLLILDTFWRRFHNVIKLNTQCSFDVFISFPKEEDMEDVTLQLTTDNFCAEKLTNWALGSGELKSKHILYSIKCEPTWYYHWQRKNNTTQESHSKLITFEYFRLYFKNKDWYKHPYIIKQFLNKKYRYALRVEINKQKILLFTVPIKLIFFQATFMPCW